MKYSLKVLSILTENQHTAYSASDLSQKTNVPIKFLEKILIELKKGGIISSKKGVKGGYTLIKNPEKVTLVDIYRLMEGPIALVPCVSLNFYNKCSDCPDEKICHLKNIFIQIRDKTLAIYEQINLTSLVGKSVQ